MNLLVRSFLPVLLFGVQAYTQTTQVIRYTTREGLPSNSIYRTLIDRKGFLWVAGETGVSRYDGRSFRNYYTTEGLPDNEVTELLLDSSGRIWAIPFRKKPAWYNERKDRFENSDTDPLLGAIETGNGSANSILTYGGIAFCNDRRDLFIWKNGILHQWRNAYPGKPKNEMVIEIRPGKYVLVARDSLRFIQDGKQTGGDKLGYAFDWCEYANGQLYLLVSQSIIKLSLLPDGRIGKIQEQVYPFPLKLMCRSGNHLAVTSYSGNTYTVDTATLSLKDNIFSQFIVRSVLEDHNGNYWLSTKDEGLVKIQQKRISSFTENRELLQNFSAILKTGKIIAGNNKGEVYVYDGLYALQKIALNAPANSADTWVRNLVDIGPSVYVATQTGSFILSKSDYSVQQTFTGLQNKSTKAAARLNDSLLLLGGHAQLFTYDFRKKILTDSVLKRVTAIGITDKGKIYIGSTNGLYRKDRDSLFYFGNKFKALTYRVVSITASGDDLLWIGRSSDSLLVLRNDVPVAAIALGSNVPGKVCKVIRCRKPGEIWIGTDKGLNRLRYTFTNGQFSYTNLYFSTTDGLVGDQVNDITFSNDTVFAATTGGISYLPADLRLPLADIATFITRVSINNKDTAVLERYTLPFSQNNLLVEFSAVDLTGFNPAFEYSINNREWIRAQNNTLSLQNQPPDNYTIRIRSIKRDGTPSSRVAEIQFHIKTPFWKSSWFWGSLAVAGFALVLIAVQRRNRSRQQKAIEKITTEKKLAELEMQALKAQINPHFVFNCLNSIKGFIYDQDYVQADRYLDKFSELMRSTIDNSDAAVISLEEEIRYLDNYLQLEKLRFDDKFEYRIDATQVEDPKYIFVPAMLLQPYVENAIRHGIRFLEGRKGMILIQLSATASGLVCRIDDNGIGRRRAAEMKSARHVEYQGKGMSISKRRAELYQIEQTITDKTGPEGEALGTTITLVIPPGLTPET